MTKRSDTKRSDTKMMYNPQLDTFICVVESGSFSKAAEKLYISPPAIFVELWPEIQRIYPDMKFQLIIFENTIENAREILANLGQNIDVVAGIFDDTMPFGILHSKEPSEKVRRLIKAINKIKA